MSQPKNAVFEALSDLMSYPQWWPDYQAVRRLDGDVFEITVRSTLPYSLVVTNKFLIRDPHRGHFRLALGRDLVGWIDFLVTDQGNGRSSVHITQECTATKPLLKILAPVAKSAFRHNHALTMRHGLTGLEERLASGNN
ncbi:polyketide cyclase [Streptomyces sp. NBC_01233]|uniref:polyketide cyclase n=1 Tax=Streptomyces sp. NBC_01233 TaxID=2903787 RepID=UPI002E0ECD20|nr:polyketide cyclase [Streptomyces sp. NBC_01233]